MNRARSVFLSPDTRELRNAAFALVFLIATYGTFRVVNDRVGVQLICEFEDVVHGDVEAVVGEEVEDSFRLDRDGGVFGGGQGVPFGWMMFVYSGGTTDGPTGGLDLDPPWP